MVFSSNDLPPASLGGNACPYPAVRAEITSRALAMLLEACRAALPNEACGALAGRITAEGSPAAGPGTVLIVEDIHPIRNAAAGRSAADSFVFEPADWIRALYIMPKNRQSLVGFYHSHPATAPVPSRADLAGLGYARPASCWIVSLTDPLRPEIVPYAFDGASFRPLMLAQISV